MANVPIVNAGLKYVNGLNLSNDATSPDEIVVIAAGAARDSSNVWDIVVDSALSVSNVLSGAGNLDTGSVAVDTLYAVFVIGDSTKYNAAAGLLSASVTPALPSGYDVYRRVGWVLTDGTSDFLVFDQVGDGQNRDMWYRASVATDVTAGASATFAAVDLSGSIPSSAKELIAKCAFTPTGANDPLELRNGDSAVDEGQAIESGSAAGVVKECNMRCPIGATVASGVDYKVTGSAVAVNVQGYVDVL